MLVPLGVEPEPSGVEIAVHELWVKVCVSTVGGGASWAHKDEAATRATAANKRWDKGFIEQR